MFLPGAYKNWLSIYNGGELFALPVGTTFFGILGESKREKGVFYLEDNFDNVKRIGVPKDLLIIGELCDGEIIAFDLQKTDLNDGVIVQYDVESANIIDSWSGFEEWINFVFIEGEDMFDYDGNDK